MKRCLAYLLCLLLCITALPVSAAEVSHAVALGRGRSKRGPFPSALCRRSSSRTTSRTSPGTSSPNWPSPCAWPSSAMWAARSSSWRTTGATSGMRWETLWMPSPAEFSDATLLGNYGLRPWALFRGGETAPLTRMGSSHGRRRLSWRRVPTRPIPARRFCRNPAADRFMGTRTCSPAGRRKPSAGLRDQAVMEGDNYGNFLPQGHLTREQAILIFYRLAREVSIPETGLVPYEEELTRALDDFTPCGAA